MTVYKTKPLTLQSIKPIKGYKQQTYTPPQKMPPNFVGMRMDISY
jgi:hypothetical protein